MQSTGIQRVTRNLAIRSHQPGTGRNWEQDASHRQPNGTTQPYHTVLPARNWPELGARCIRHVTNGYHTTKPRGLTSPELARTGSRMQATGSQRVPHDLATRSYQPRTGRNWKQDAIKRHQRVPHNRATRSHQPGTGRNWEQDAINRQPNGITQPCYTVLPARNWPELGAGCKPQAATGYHTTLPHGLTSPELAGTGSNMPSTGSQMAPHNHAARSHQPGTGRNWEQDASHRQPKGTTQPFHTV